MHCHHATHLILLFFFNDTATTEIYTLSLHDALPILLTAAGVVDRSHRGVLALTGPERLSFLHNNTTQHLLGLAEDRKSTRLNSSHVEISYAVFCLKKKKKRINICNRRVDLVHEARDA